jgi:hypothetical protein
MMMTELDSGHQKPAEVTGLNIALDARDPAWELPPIEGESYQVALIAWLTDVEPIDEGVPPLVRTIVSRALTRLSRVTFPCSRAGLPGTPTDWHRIPEGWVRMLKPRLGTVWRRRPPIMLLSTTSAEPAARLFASFPFSWEMKAQVAILSDLDAPPPDLSYEAVESLLNRETIDVRALVAEAQARGLLLPAVDGDFAALIVFDSTLLRVMVEALAEECGRAGVGWQTVMESALLRK